MGSFARGTLLEALPAGVRRVAVMSGTGLAAADAVSRLGFERAAASAEEILEDDAITDPHSIFAHDPRRGIAWEIDVKDLVAR